MLASLRQYRKSLPDCDDSGKTMNKLSGAQVDMVNRLFFKLYKCANMLHKTGSRAVEVEGLTTQQWAVLGALSREPAGAGLSIGELAHY